MLQAPSSFDASGRRGEFSSDFSFEDAAFQQQTFPIMKAPSDTRLIMAEDALLKRDDIGMEAEVRLHSVVCECCDVLHSCIME